MDERERPIPDIVIDYWLKRLTPHQLRMLIYILRKTYCIHDATMQMDIDAVATELSTTPGMVSLDLDGLRSEELIHLGPDSTATKVNILLREWIFLNRFPDGWTEI